MLRCICASFMWCNKRDGATCCGYGLTCASAEVRDPNHKWFESHQAVGSLSAMVPFVGKTAEGLTGELVIVGGDNYCGQ